MSGPALAHREAIGLLVARRARDRRRGRIVDAGLLLLIGALGMLALGLGAVALSATEVVAALLGLEGAPGAAFIVQEVRLPRLVLALLVGAALGLAGALLQSVVRNPLASPDIVGIAQGASAAGVLVIVTGASGAAVTGAAILGALLAATLAFALGGRGASGARFVVVGVAIAFLANGVLGYALTRAALVDAGSAYFWLVGSVGSPSWADIALVGGVLAGGAALLLGGRRLLEVQAFDDTTARALGAHPVAVRVCAIIVTSALTAVAVGAAGPIAFVAFASGPIARGLRGRGPALGTAALVGAAAVLGSDLIAQHAIPSTFQPPVGLVTGALGSLVLLVLLVRGDRRPESRA
ncbi:FecCD family ABC transporter permease [Microcella sp.]|uniref:FecCD family ABC transporter permease n=1 Tax=Microcella sp. TaxID=1913979 RepID=UPI0039196948